MSGRDLFDGCAALPLQLAELVGLREDGARAFVVEATQPDLPAREARSVVDLHAAHIGAQVALLFEAGDPRRPVIMGVLRDGRTRSRPIHLDADGERIVVTAEHQLVLRCGKACITLTRAGKVLIEGSYVLSRSSGVNRVQGGSVQLN
jgi:hypothetical protein